MHLIWNLGVIKDGEKRIVFFKREVIKWWGENKRNYPWRNSPTPYESMIAEVMLQKTPAERVCKVFNSFLSKFPDIYSLAYAKENDICSYFRQLGLKKRGLWLKKTAIKIVHDFKGCIPSDASKLKSLPGIGEYTANAVLVFSKKKRLPLLDINFKRLYSRFFGVDFFKSKDFLLRVTPERDFISYYYAVLDFSARVCTAKKPSCVQCPLNSMCDYFNEGGRK